MPRRLRILTVIAALAGLALVAAAPSYAVLAAPTPDTTDVGTPVPAFHWTSVSGAAQYQVQISAASDFSALLNPDPNSQLTKNTYYTLTTTVPDCTCYWRVRAVSSTGVSGAWSSATEWDKSSSAPTPSAPSDGDTVTYPTPLVLSWDPADGAQKYEVLIGDSPSLTGTPVETSATHYAPTGWLANGTHWWAVAVKDANNVTSAYSTPQSFDWEWPSAVSGLTVTDTVDSTGDSYADDTIYEPRFSWDAVAGAAKYDVDISLDSNFATGSTTRYTTIGTSLSPTAVLENADYYWRVRAIDPASGVGDWTYGGDAAAPGDSFSESYDTQSPSINNLRMTDVTSDPGNDDDADSGDGYQTTEPIVQWDPVPGAGAYVVDVRQYDLNDPSAGCNWSGVLGQKKWLNIVEGNAWTPLGSGLGAGNTVLPGKSPSKDSTTAALVVGNAYCVRVKPVRLINGVAAPWTYLDPSNDGTDWAFQYDGPPAGDVCQPSCASEDYLGADDYLTPQTGSTSTSMPLFTWNPISGAGGYFVVVATDQAMTHVIDYAWTEVPAYSPRTSSASSLVSYPDSTTNYYWQVFPANGINGTGANGVAGQGDRGSFLKQTIPPTLVSPVGGETVDGQVTFQWLPVYGATRYTLQVSDDPNFPTSGSHILETLNSTYSTSYTSTLNNFKSGLLYWRVQAIDAKGTALSWTAPESFTQTYDVPTFDGIDNPTEGSDTPVLQWNPVPGAISYDVDMLCSVGQSCTDGTAIKTTAHTMLRLTGVGDIGWHVRANFPGGAEPSDWSATQTYTHTIPDPTNPSTLRTSTGTLFSWDAMPGATKYKVEISRSNSFATTIGGGSFLTQNTSWAPTLSSTDYLNGGTFYWRVRSQDGDGNLGQPTPAQLMSTPASLSKTTVSPGILLHGTTTTVTVTVKSFDDHAVAGARVAVSGAGLKATSKLTGTLGKATFKLHPTKKGTITFSITKTGYQSLKKTVTSR